MFRTFLSNLKHKRLKELITINKGIPLIKNDLDRYKRVYSVSEQLVNFIESLEEHQLFDAKSSRQQKDGIIYMLKF